MSRSSRFRIFPLRPPTDWEELVQTYDDWAISQAALDELPDPEMSCVPFFGLFRPVSSSERTTKTHRPAGNPS